MCTCRPGYGQPLCGNQQLCVRALSGVTRCAVRNRARDGVVAPWSDWVWVSFVGKQRQQQYSQHVVAYIDDLGWLAHRIMTMVVLSGDNSMENLASIQVIPPFKRKRDGIVRYRSNSFRQSKRNENIEVKMWHDKNRYQDGEIPQLGKVCLKSSTRGVRGFSAKTTTDSLCVCDACVRATDAYDVN